MTAPPADGGLGVERVAAALLVWQGRRPGAAVRVLAGALPVEPGRTAVVVDPASVSGGFWPQLVSRLHGLPPGERSSLRLVLSGAGAGASAGQLTGPAHWLAEQLRAEVVAPDGTVLPVADGSVFVLGSAGSGGWWSFRPGQRPALVGVRYPPPQWEQLLPARPLRSASGLVAEPIPAGLWVHAPTDPAKAPRVVENPAFGLRPDPNRVAIVVGGQGEPPVDQQELHRLLATLPAALPPIAAVLQYDRLPTLATPTRAPTPGPAQVPHRPPPGPPLAAGSPVPALGASPAPIPVAPPAGGPPAGGPPGVPPPRTAGGRPVAAPSGAPVVPAGRPSPGAPRPGPGPSVVPGPSRGPAQAPVGSAPAAPSRAPVAGRPGGPGRAGPGWPAVPPGVPPPPPAVRPPAPGRVPVPPPPPPPAARPPAVRPPAPGRVPVPPPPPPAVAVPAGPVAAVPPAPAGMAAVPRPRFGGPAAGARRGPAGPAPIRALPAGVVIASGGFEPALTVLAPWWQPDPELYAVVVRFDRAVFGVGDRWLPAPEFGELVAGQPDWGGRPVLLIVEGKVANSAVQQLADVLQVGVVTGPAAQGRWWAAMPRRADRGQAQVRALGARYPFSPAELAGLRVARPLPLPVGPGAAAALLADRLQPGAVLDQPGFPAGEPSRERFNRWRGSAWRPGQFGVAVRRGFGYPAAPYRNGELLWTTWQLANALWEIREQWADASELVLLTDGTPGGNLGELRLLANYLQVAVRAGNRPLWTGQDRVEVASATVRPDADGRLRPALAVPPDGRWITVRPRGGLRPPARPAAPTQPARRPATAAPGLDVRLDRILRDSTRTAAGRRLTPEDWPDPPVRDVLSRLPIQPGLYPVEVAAVAGAFTYRSDRLAVGELGRLLAADAESAGRPILLITDLGLAAADRDPAAAARQLADAAGVPVVATAGHVYVSRDGVLVAAGSFRRFAPGAPAGSAPTVSLPGLRRARVPAADALVAEQVHAPAELPPPPPAAAESAADSPAAPTPAPTPATEVPATEVPATEVPATEVPATAVPATAVPAVEAPAVETAVAPPATEVPVVEASAVETAVEAPAEPAVPPAVEVAQPPPEQPPAAEPPAVEVAAEEPPTAEARTAGEPAEARTAGEPAEARTAGEPAGPPAAEAAQPPAAATDESGRS